MEKEAILNSYKIFLKTINFDFQIIIQSNKEDLSHHFSQLNNILNQEEKNIQEISKKYINYLKELNNSKKSSSKNYFIIIDYKKETNNTEFYASEELNNKFLKIKEALSRCGNVVENINEKEKIKEILNSFINNRIYSNKN